MTDEQEADRIRKHFAKHVATLSPRRRECQILRWQAPTTCIYLVEYVCVNGILFVSGDVGCAAYVAYGCLDRGWDLREWSACELDYFASKCRASEYGLPCKEWSRDTALAYLETWKADRLRDAEDGEGEAVESEDQDWFPAWEEALGRVDSQRDWEAFLGLRGEDLFGSDWWEYGNIGMRVGLRIRYHLIGLQMALAQLHERSVELLLSLDRVAGTVEEFVTFTLGIGPIMPLVPCFGRGWGEVVSHA